METILIQAEESRIDALIQYLRAYNYSFELKHKKQKKYDPEFVAKIVERSQNVEKGEYQEYNSTIRTKWFHNDEL